MQDFIASLPKAELHLHLEGCVEPDALWQMAGRQRSPLFQAGPEALDRLFSTDSFPGFLQAFKAVCQHLQSPADYEQAACSTIARLARQNVRYAEITISAGVILWKGEDLFAQFEAIDAGRARAQREFPIRVQWIFDATRHFGPEPAMAVARAAVALRDRGVVAFGIGGDEQLAPPELFRDVYAYARSQGLRLTAHAGETAGPESVRGAVEVLRAERIGHGLSAARDPAVMDLLAQRQIPVEVCLTSSLRTGRIAGLAQHPLPEFLARGIPICLSTDDPALFATDLNREYLLAHQIFGLGPEELARLAQSSFRAAFLPPEEIASHLRTFPAPLLFSLSS